MCRNTNKKTSKRTICALVAGSIAALGATGLFTITSKDASANQSESRLYSSLDNKNTGGWYSNKVQRGQIRRKRIFRFMG